MSSDGPSPALKLIVYSMGILLVGGMVLLAVLVMQKLDEGTLFKNKEEAAIAACSGLQVDMRGRGALMNADMEGQKLRLWFEKEDGTNQLVTADSCTGIIVREVTIKADTL